MKLHLSKILRAAVIASAFVSAQAADSLSWADNWGNHILEANTSYELVYSGDSTGHVLVKSDAEGNGTTIEVQEGVTQTVLSVSQNGDTTTNPWGYTKSGGGTLIVQEAPLSDGGRQEDYTIAVTGGTLIFEAENALGNWSSTPYVSSLTVQDSTVVVYPSEAAVCKVTLNGNAMIDGGIFSSDIYASGTNNVMYSDIDSYSDVNVEVAAESDLWISWISSDAYVSGEGTLSIGGASGNIAVADGATLVLENTELYGSVSAGGVTIAAKDGDSALISQVQMTSSELGYAGEEYAEMRNADITVEAGSDCYLWVDVSESALTLAGTLEVGGSAILDSTVQVLSGGKLDGGEYGYFAGCDISVAVGEADVTSSGQEGVYTLMTTEQLSCYVFGEDNCFDVNLEGLKDVLGGEVHLGLIFANLEFEGIDDMELYFRLSGAEGLSITSVEAYSTNGANVGTILYIDSPAAAPAIPEPSTATLSLLALSALAARRRRK